MKILKNPTWPHVFMYAYFSDHEYNYSINEWISNPQKLNLSVHQVFIYFIELIVFFSLLTILQDPQRNFIVCPFMFLIGRHIKCTMHAFASSFPCSRHFPHMTFKVFFYNSVFLQTIILTLSFQQWLSVCGCWLSIKLARCCLRGHLHRTKTEKWYSHFQRQQFPRKI